MWHSHGRARREGSEASKGIHDRQRYDEKLTTTVIGVGALKGVSIHVG